MTFISVKFLAFLAIIFAAYFIVPLAFRYLVLLAASLLFYTWAGIEKMPFLLAAWAVTYLAGILIDRTYKKDGKSKAKAQIPFWIGICTLLFMLVYAKAGKELIKALSLVMKGNGFTPEVIVPLGISYYTFAAIGYLADVYWKKDKADYNPLSLLLYFCFFPQILQGPIPKHKRLGAQLREGHRFDYTRVCFGFQRMIWGFFKKMVIADRLAVMVKEVFDNYLNYEGAIFIIGLAGAVFQLYCDFSGCMDIALGIAEVFGITLDENFKRPFFAKSAAEFWRRWHISLGNWFKDYIYMPLTVSPALMKPAKWLNKRGAKRAAKNLLTVVPLLVVWFLTGLWHGTGTDYIVWGLYWGILIILSSVFAPEIKKVNQFLKLNKDLKWWQAVQQLRTFCIYMIGRLLTIPGNLLTSRWIGRKIFTYNPWVLVNGTIYTLGWDRLDAWIAIFSLLLLWRVSCLQESGIEIRKEIAKLPLPLRWCIYIGGILLILVFGIYGKGASVSTFSYVNY